LSAYSKTFYIFIVPHCVVLFAYRNLLMLKNHNKGSNKHSHINGSAMVTAARGSAVFGPITGKGT